MKRDANSTVPVARATECRVSAHLNHVPNNVAVGSRLLVPALSPEDIASADLQPLPFVTSGHLTPNHFNFVYQIASAELVPGLSPLLSCGVALKLYESPKFHESTNPSRPL